MAIEKHILSKSTFVRGLQCKKSLFLYKNYYHLRDKVSEEKQATFDRGHEIGKLAQQLFPNGIDASPSSVFKYSESVEATKKYIVEGKKVIYEAAFQYEQVMVAVDILVFENGAWNAYEVKSSTRLTQSQLTDASIQHYVIKKSGIDLNSFQMIHVNNQYERVGKFDLKEFFKITDVSEHMTKEMEFIGLKVGELKSVIYSSDMPDVKIGAHCSQPYDCDFRGTCWKNIPEHSVFNLIGVSMESQFELYDNGIKTLDDIMDVDSLPKQARMQTICHQQKKPIVEKEKVKSFLEGLNFPLYFVDFESYQPAVPLFQHTRPFQQIPFQFSIHFIEMEDSELKHEDYISDSGIDPRKGFLEEFLKRTKSASTILAYNLSFEKMVLKDLIAVFPEKEKEINETISKMQDLMLPFRQFYYYTAEMNGSASIKNVLPALVPEMGYKHLEISNGFMASSAFDRLANESDMFKIQEIKSQLLEYCKLDTLAMVEIWKKLKEVIAK